MTTSELDKRFSFFRQPKKIGRGANELASLESIFFFFILVCICYFFVLFFFSFCMCYWFLFHLRCYFGVCVFCETEILVISLFSIFCRHFVSYRLINTCNVMPMNNESTNRPGSLTYLKTLSVLSCWLSDFCSWRYQNFRKICTSKRLLLMLSKNGWK